MKGSVGWSGVDGLAPLLTPDASSDLRMKVIDEVLRIQSKLMISVLTCGAEVQHYNPFNGI